MKKFLLIFAMIGAVAASSWAFDSATWWKTYAEPVQKKHVLLNLGFGLGYGFGGIVSADFPVKMGPMPFTLGASFAFNYDNWGYGSVDGVKEYYYYITPAFRFGWHPNFGVKGLDVYALASLGLPFSYYHYAKWNPNKYWYPNYWGHGWGWYTGGYDEATDWDFEWAGLFGLGVGLHYYFGDSQTFGVFAELGWLSLNYMTVGFSLAL